MDDDADLASIDFAEIGEDLERFQEDETVQQALHRGVDLKKYGQDLERELKEAEMESIDQYMENSQQVLDLHKQMQDCDAVLARMQEMLLGFQADLGGISEEIKYLQDESLSMSICLKNKKAAEEKLRYFLENAAISGDMVNSVVNGPVNELFLESIVALSVRLKFLKSPPSSFEIPVAETAAGQSLQPELARLKLKAIVKSKEYFTTQFQALRKPKTNIQMLQQNSLVKFAPLYHFLSREAPSVADELKSIYIDSMNRTILNLFKNYSLQLSKLELSISSKTDTIAIEEAAMKAAMKANVSKKSDPFAIGDRHMLLDRIEDEPILVHVAIAESQKYPYEVLFRSIIKHLIDSACNEFLFILDFFKCAPSDSFSKIFGKTISMILENLENFLLNCYDSVGLLLMIKSSYAQHLIMQRRRIPVLDSLFDRISLLLWPRFKFVLDLNIKSIRGISLKKIGHYDVTPHYITRRYADLVAALMKLQSGGDNSTGSTTATLGIAGGGDSMLMGDLIQLRLEMGSFLEKLSTNLPGPKEQRVFLVNNYDLILSVFQEQRLVATDELQKIEDMFMMQRELFAEEEVKQAFVKLVTFVLQAEQQMAAAGGKGRISPDESAVENLIREFSANWKVGVQKINDDVLAYFASSRNGMEILKQVLTQLLLYYTRFQDIVKKSFDRPPAFTRDIVSTATILLEIKKYSRAF